MVAPSIQVQVCTWDPKHTLTRIEAQQRALARGDIAKLVKKFGAGTQALRDAMTKVGLVSSISSLDGSVHCPQCGCLMDTVLAGPGITNKVEAYRDVAEHFTDAIQRTRASR